MKTEYDWVIRAYVAIIVLAIVAVPGIIIAGALGWIRP